MSDHDALLVAYQEYTADIRHAKRNQWASVYYALLVLAGLIGYFQLLDEDGVGLGARVAIWGAYALTAVFIAWYIWSTQFSMERNRQKVQEIRTKIGGEFKQVLSEKDPRRDYEFPIMFSVVIWVGAGFLFWVIFRGQIIGLVISLLVLAVLMGGAIFWARCARTN